MRKAELVNCIAKKTGFPIVDVEANLDATCKAIMEVLATGETIYIRGFGTYQLKKRKAKNARNIKAGTTVFVPEHCIPVMKPCKEFKDSVANAGVK